MLFSPAARAKRIIGELRQSGSVDRSHYTALTMRLARR